MNMNAMGPQLAVILEPLFSIHFLYLAGMAVLLLQKKLSEKQFNAILFLASFAYFYLFYGEILQIFRMAGDNICQIAYWKILFHPSLTGSIGASYTKPGQLVLLGLLHDISRFCGEASVQIGLCLIMAVCVWSLSRIATDIGGRVAGIMAFIAASWVFFHEFIAGSISIFLIPVIFIGLWLYYFKPGHKALGRFLLVVSIQFHIQAIAILSFIWIIVLFKKDWKELAVFSGLCSASLALWTLVILRVQGTIARFDSGGAAGYVGSFGDPFLYDSKAEYIFKTVWTELLRDYSVRGLLLLAAFGIIGAIYHNYKHYLVVFSVLLLLVVNVFVFNGTIVPGRHFALLYAFSCSVGIASAVRFALNPNRLPKVAYAFTTCCLLLLMITLSSLSAATASKRLRNSGLEDYVVGASNLLSDSNLPPSTRLMTEDDLLYPIVVMALVRYPHLTSLQYFNIAPEPQRKTILATTDYIWIVRNNRHMYYYLNYLPEPAWASDPFRQMANDILRTNQPRSLYGYRFLPIAIDNERLILRVMPEKSG